MGALKDVLGCLVRVASHLPTTGRDVQLKEDTADEGILADLQLPSHGLSLADTDPATSIDCASTNETLSEKRPSAETIQTTAPEDDEISATMPVKKQHPVLEASSTGQKLSQVEVALPVQSMCPSTKTSSELMEIKLNNIKLLQTSSRDRRQQRSL